MECCNNKIKKAINEADAYVERARLCTTFNKYDEALLDLLKASQLNPETRDIDYLIACCYKQKDQIDNALLYYDKAIAKNPDLTNAYNDKADLLFSLKRYDETLELLNKVIEKDSCAESYYKRGMYFYILKQSNNALPDLLNAVEMDHQMTDAYFYIADTYDRKRNHELAIKYYNNVIKLDANYDSAYNNIGWIYEKEKKYDEGLKYYQKALEIDPNEKLYSRNIKRVKGLMKK